MWVNCLNYVDLQRQAWRLRKKEYDFNDWYNINFKVEYRASDILGNG